MKKQPTESQIAKLWVIKRTTKRSWIQLRRGCLELSGKDATHSTYMVGATSRSFARKVVHETGMDYATIIAWLDESGLVPESPT